MIGQKNILEKFNTFEKIPSSVVLLGPSGSGKKTVINTIIENIGADIFNIDKVFDDETKLALCSCPNRMVVVFDLTKDIAQKTTVNLQNSALKFIEELPDNLRVFILAENETFVLDTVLNRSYVQQIDNYSKEELLEIARVNNKSLEDYSEEEIDYLKWPADVIMAPGKNELSSMESLIDTIFTSIGKANISNTLTIAKKISFNNEIGLYDLRLFLNIFEHKLVRKIVTEGDNKYHRTFTIFNNMVYNINRYNNNKVYIFEEFLLDIKQVLV